MQLHGLWPTRLLSVQFSCSVVSDSVTPWTAARQASLSITNSQSLLKLMSIASVMPLTISSSVTLFSSCLQSFPASGSLPMSLFFTLGGQSIGVSASTSVLPMNIQDWFPLGWTGWIFLAVQGTLKSLLQHHSSKASILWLSAFHGFLYPWDFPGKNTGACCHFLHQGIFLMQRLNPRFLYPWDFPGKNTGVCCHFLLQGIFLMQRLNPHLLHCRWILYHWTMEESRETQC